MALVNMQQEKKDPLRTFMEHFGKLAGLYSRKVPSRVPSSAKVELDDSRIVPSKRNVPTVPPPYSRSPIVTQLLIV
ncbi:hypothetical protein JHK82_024601 [Glycine max]|nr:hypothetical protein JHK85_025205 [Glycine max]KAG5133413.1 hypothetical protein JHK82_024601 [Glycine max]